MTKDPEAAALIALLWAQVQAYWLDSHSEREQYNRVCRLHNRCVVSGYLHEELWEEEEDNA